MTWSLGSAAVNRSWKSCRNNRPAQARHGSSHMHILPAGLGPTEPVLRRRVPARLPRSGCPSRQDPTIAAAANCELLIPQYATLPKKRKRGPSSSSTLCQNGGSLQQVQLPGSSSDHTSSGPGGGSDSGVEAAGRPGVETHASMDSPTQVLHRHPLKPWGQQSGRFLEGFGNQTQHQQQQVQVQVRQSQSGPAPGNGPEWQQQQQEQQRQYQQHPRHRQHLQYNQLNSRAARGPDALMRAIMEASTVHQLHTVVIAELQAAAGAGGAFAEAAAAVMMQSPMPSEAMAPSPHGAPPQSPRMRPIHVAAAIVRLSKLPYRCHSSSASRNDGIVAGGSNGDEGSGAIGMPPVAATAAAMDLRPGAAPHDSGGGDCAAVSDEEGLPDSRIQRRQLLQALLALACSQARFLTARQLVNVMWALGRMEADKALRDVDGGLAGAAGGGMAAMGGGGSNAAASPPPSLDQLEVLVSELLGQRVQVRRWEEEEEAEEAEEAQAWREACEAKTGRAHGGEAPPPPLPCKLEQASCRELANFAWAAAQLRLASPLLWAAVRRLAAARLIGGRAEVAPTTAAAVNGLQFNAADLANLSWALARARQAPGEELGRGLVHAALELIEDFDVVSLAGLLWGLGTGAACMSPAPLSYQTPQPPPGPSISPPAQSSQQPDLATSAANDIRGGSDGGGGGNYDWVTQRDLLPLLLHRAAPRVVSELSQQRMRPQEVVSLTLGLAAAAATARSSRPGVPPPPLLLQALADHIACNAVAFVGDRTTGGPSRPDNLATVLLALVRCVEGPAADGGSGGAAATAAIDLRVARRVERALEGAARQVVRSLPRASPASLAALAVAYSNRATGGVSGRGSGGAAVAATAEITPSDGRDLITASSSGLLPPPPSSAGPAIPPVRAAVLRATLRAALRLLPTLPDPPTPVPSGAVTPDAAVTAAGGGGGRGVLDARHIREVVAVLWWSVQGLGGGEEGVAEELRLAAPWLIQRALPLCRPADVALLAAAYARAGCHPPAIMTALSAAARAAAPKLTPLDLSQLAWAAAAAAGAGATRDALLLSVLEGRCIELLRGGSWVPGQELAVVLWAFAKLKHYSEPLLDAAAAVLKSPRHLAVSRNSAQAAKSLAARPLQLPSSRLPPSSLQPSPRLLPQELAMVASALGQLRYYDAQLMQLLAARVETDVELYSARTLTWALSAFASLNSPQPRLLHAAAARIRHLLLRRQRRNQHQHNAKQQQQLQQLLQPESEATGVFRPAASGKQQQQEGQQQQGGSSPKGYCRGWRRDGQHIGIDNNDGSDYNCDEEDGPPLTAFDAVTLLWSFGVLQHVDLDCLQGLMRILPSDPRVYSTSDLSRLGLADAMLRGALTRYRHHRQHQDQDPNNMAAEAAFQTPREEADNGGNSGGWSGGGGYGGGGWLLPAELGAAVVRSAGSQRSRVSGLQREVAATLRGMGLRPKLEVAMGVFTLDLRLDLPEGWRWEGEEGVRQQEQEIRQQSRTGQQRSDDTLDTPAACGGGGGGGGGAEGDGGFPLPGRRRQSQHPQVARIAVEVDGPSHFCANVPNHALGATVARDRCLQELGLQLVVVPHFEWDLLQSRQAKRTYLARRLVAAAAAPPPPLPSDGADRRSRGGGGGGDGGGNGPAGRTTSRALFPALTITTHVVRQRQ